MNYRQNLTILRVIGNFNFRCQPDNSLQIRISKANNMDGDLLNQSK